MFASVNTPRLKLLAIAGVTGLALAACGSSKATSTPGPTTSESSSSPSSAPSSSSTGAPLSIGLLMSVKGEDPYAINDYYQGAELALDEINAAGGFHGQPIKSFRVPAFQDPTSLSGQFLKLAAMKPDIIVGAPPPALAAIARQVNQTAIPVLGTSSYAIIDGHDAGSKWVFMTLASDANTVNAAAEYAVDGLGAKKIAVLHTNESFGQSGSTALAKDIPAAGGTVITDQSFSPTATDLTSALLAAKSAQAIVSWAYPGPQAVGINALANQGSSTPTVGNAGISSSVTNGIIAKAGLTKIYSTVPCNTQDPRPATAKFLAAFQAKFHTVPSYISAQVYDSIYLAVAAATAAKDLSNTSLLAAITGLDYTNGVCATDYKADATGVLVHTVTIQGFTASSVAVTKKIYTFPPATS